MTSSFADDKPIAAVDPAAMLAHAEPHYPGVQVRIGHIRRQLVSYDQTTSATGKGPAYAYGQREHPAQGAPGVFDGRAFAQVVWSVGPAGPTLFTHEDLLSEA